MTEKPKTLLINAASAILAGVVVAFIAFSLSSADLDGRELQKKIDKKADIEYVNREVSAAKIECKTRIDALQSLSEAQEAHNKEIIRMLEKLIDERQ